MILRRYMMSQVLTTALLVLGFLVVMLLGGRLIRYFGIAAEGGLEVGVLWTLIGYNLPYFLELILPLAFFIALMLTFGRMYADHEMAVLTASGISRGALSWALLPLLLLMVVLHGIITLVGKPWGVARATNLWQEQSVIEIFKLIRPKTFISSGDYHLYVGEVGKDNAYLKDVIVISMNGKGSLIETPTKKDDITDPSTTQTTDLSQKIPKALLSQKDTIIYAKSATQVNSDDGVVRLDLHEGRRYEVDSTTREYSQVGFGRYRISLLANSQKDPKDMKIEGVPTTALLHRADNEARAEMGYRLSLPFLMVIAILLATPLATVRPRQGRWLKLIPAIFIFVANVLILISLKETISKGKVGVWVYPVALSLMVVFGVYLNYHERLMARFRLSAHSKGAL